MADAPYQARTAQADAAEIDAIAAYLAGDAHREVLRKAIESAEFSLHMALQADTPAVAQALRLDLERLKAEYDATGPAG